MAGFTIPNAPDTDKSTLDQSEPDRVDFEILGNRRKGVVTGGGVTASSGAIVAVAAATIAYEGADYALSANASYTLSAAPSSGTRFDLVVARYATGAVSLQTVTGTASTTNPTFPTLLSTDVVLAAVLRRTSASIVTNDIIDKRAFCLPSVQTLSIVNADVNASAAIAYSKLNLASSITSADIVNGTIATADIADGAITTAKLASGAAQAGFNSTINPQTGTVYSFVLSDVGKLVEFSNTSAITLSIPLTSSVAFALGDRIDLLQTNIGQVTVQAASGVTLVSESSKTKLNGRWAAATLIKRATDSWVLIGNITDLTV
jgi:hypothetical protein